MHLGDTESSAEHHDPGFTRGTVILKVIVPINVSPQSPTGAAQAPKSTVERDKSEVTHGLLAKPKTVKCQIPKADPRYVCSLLARIVKL